MILDGWGENPSPIGNAVAAAKHPNVDALRANWPFTTLDASGSAVGLPDGQMGNSEVGHLTIGSGRIIYQDLVRINAAIDEGPDGNFYRNAEVVALAQKVKARGGRMHIIGLTSDGGVHSSEKHYFAALEAMQKLGFGKAGNGQLFYHAFLDGRDTPPRSGIDCIRRLQPHCDKVGATIATVIGRYWAMDRDKRWERTQRAYDAMVLGKGEAFDTAEAALLAGYEGAEHNTDEFITPRIIASDGVIRDGDGIWHINYRADRTRQLSAALVHDTFPTQTSKVDDHDVTWTRGKRPQIDFLATTHYDDSLPVPEAFPPQSLANVLGEVISDAGMVQFRTSETEKYAHVTYFLNGGVEKQFAGEERRLVPSPKVATYDLQPEMSSAELTDVVVEAVNSGTYDFIMMNYPNPDMVGHTGVFSAVVKCLEAVDAGVGRIVAAVQAKGGACLITADHGNAEQLIHDNCPEEYKRGDPNLVPKEFRHTQHTTNPVPCMLVHEGSKGRSLRSGCGLKDLAPTVLDLLGLELPPEMSGRTLRA
ncbi:MAG: 2,3-bisphosphoglycerate-independent phosphoglycerate mutase [Planctomycetota bacterium]